MLKPIPSKPGLFSGALKQFSGFKGIAVSTLLTVGLVLAFVGTAAPQVASAATNNTLNFQARLETAAGAIVPDGNYDVTFHLYNALSSSGSTDTTCNTDANCLWEETYSYNSGAGSSDARLRVTNGYLTVNLGSLTSFPTTINWDQSLWLSMDIGGTTSSGTITWDGQMSPRLALTSVPYAFRAGTLATGNGTYSSTLSLVQPASATQVFQVPDQGSAGTYNLLTGGSVAGAIAGVVLQSGTPGTVQTGNFNISGTGIAGTALQTPTLDTPSGTGTLNIGKASGGNASSIELNLNTQIGTGTTGSSAPHFLYISEASTNAAGNALLTGDWKSPNNWGFGPNSSSTTDNTLRIGTTTTNGGNTWSTSANINLLVAGTETIQPTTGNDSKTAFQVQNANGEPLFNVDTTNTTNLVTNPDGSAGPSSPPTGWTATGTGASATRNTAAANIYTGFSSLQDVTGTTANGGAEVTGFSSALTPGTYSLSFYAATASGSFTDLSVTIVGGGAPACTTSSTTNSPSTTVGTGFNNYYCTFTSTGTNVTGIVIGESGTTTHTFYLNGVTLVSGSTPLYDYTNGTVQILGDIASPLTLQPTNNTNNAFQINRQSGQTIFSVDTAANHIMVGSVAACEDITLTGQFCVGQNVTGTGNFANNKNVLNTSGSGGLTATGMQLVLDDTGSGADTIQGMVVDSTNGNSGGGSSNTAATINSIVANVPSANAGNLLQLESSSANVLTVSNTGATTLKNQTNSTGAFQVDNTSGVAALNIDTTASGMSTTTNIGRLNINGVANPTAPTLTSAGTGGTLAAATYYYELASIGQTGIYSTAIASSPTSVTTSGSTSKNTLTWTAVTNATGYIIYRSTNGTTWFSNTVTSSTLSIADNGSTYTWATSATPQTWNATGGVGLQQDTALVLDGGTGNFGAQLSYSSYYKQVILGDYNAGAGVMIQGNSFSFEDTTGYTNDLQISNTGATVFQNRTNSTTAFQIETAGGTPTTVLNVDTTNDQVTINANGIPLKLNETAAGKENGILFQNTGGSTGELGISGSANNIINNSVSGDLALKAAGGNILFSASTANNSVEQMRLTQSGNLGIGTGSTANTTSRLTVPWKSGDTTPTATIGSTTSGDNQVGVKGVSDSSIGVYGYSNSYAGIFGQSLSGSSGIFQANASTDTSPTLLVQQQGAGTAYLFEAMDSSSNDLFSIDPSGLTTIDTPTNPTGLNVLEGIQQYGYSYYDANGTYGGDYVELGECDIVNQYQGCYTTFHLAIQSDGNPNYYGHATIAASIYQQAAMGSAPYVNMTVDGVEEVIAASNLVAVTTTNTCSNSPTCSTGNTTVKLYAKYTENWGGYNYTIDNNEGYPGWTLTSEGSPSCTSAATCYIATLPAGTQNTASYGDSYDNSLLIKPSGSPTSDLQIQNSSGVSLFNVASDGSTTISPSATTNQSLTVQDGAGVQLLGIKGSNRHVIIGLGSTGEATPALLVLESGTSASDPAASSDGAMYYNSNMKSFRCQQNGYWAACDGLMQSNTTASNPISNTTTNTAFSGGNGSTYTIPANDCQPGVTYLVTATGWYDTTLTPTITYSFNFGATTLMATGAMATASNTVGEAGWKLEATLVCDTTGTSGTIETQGEVMQSSAYTSGLPGYGTDGHIGMMSDTSAQTMNTTVSNTIKIYAQWSAASTSNKVELRQLVVQRLGP